MIIQYRLLLTLALAATAVPSGQGRAQGTFPAPLPGQLQAGDSASPSASGAPSASVAPPVPFAGAGVPPSGSERAMSADPQGSLLESCMADFIPLRQEAERRGKLIKAASERHAPPDEACRLIGDFERAEAGMIKYVEAHMRSCAIPEQVSQQLRNGHNGTEALLKKVCSAADGMRKGTGPAGPTGDFDRPAGPT